MADGNLPPKKRRKVDTVTFVSATNRLELLPDNVLLCVLGYLDAVSLKRAGAVCRRLCRFSNDPTLWKTVDLSLVAKSMNIRKLQRIIHHVLKPSTEQISVYASKSHFNLTNNTLKLLNAKCPQIASLSFTGCTLTSLAWTDLVQFTHLAYLGIERCDFNGTRFFDCVDFKQLPKLKGLSFSGGSLFQVGVAKLPGLVSLNLIECTNIWNTALRDITDAKDLQYLSLPFSALLDVYASTKLLKLKSLVIGGAKAKVVRNPTRDIQSIARVSPNLIFLDLSDCDYCISLSTLDEFVSLIIALPCLKVLGLVGHDISKDMLDQLLQAQPCLTVLTEQWKLLAYKIRNKIPICNAITM
ncbi:F-box and leucine-rich repeat protein 13-like [Dysidea avara]|uniref:F-box and leucine-rich repeat protein 13-like n=1 Tax=Dysidea avara TaxID=196820 RepID=UPI00331FB7E8